MATAQQIADFLAYNSNNPQAIAEARSAHPEITDAEISAGARLLVAQFGNDPNVSMKQFERVGAGLGFNSDDVNQFVSMVLATPAPVLAPAPVPLPIVPVLGSGAYQTFSPLFGQAVYRPGESEETGVPQANSDPLIGGVQYQSIIKFANNSPDPAQAMQLEIAHLRRFGIEPINHPLYGWIAQDDARFAQAHPNVASSSIFDFGPFFLGGGLALLAAGVGAGVAGTYSTLGGAGEFLGAGAADLAMELAPGTAISDFVGAGAADLAMEIAPGMTVSEFATGLTAVEQAAIASNFSAPAAWSVDWSALDLGAAASKLATGVASTAAVVGGKVASAALLSALTPAQRAPVTPGPFGPAAPVTPDASGDMFSMLALLALGFFALKG